MKNITAILAFVAAVFASAMPAHAQMFRQAMADSVYEQNIPQFRQMGLMGPTGMDVNLDVVAIFALEMATRDGSLATLPEEFRTADAYKTKFRTVNGLTAGTMPLEEFRALVAGQGIRLLRPSDFAAAPPAPIAAPTPVVAATPAPVVAPVRVATPADTARIRGLETRIAAAESAAQQGRITPAQLAELQALRAELNKAKTDIGALTTTATALDGRVTTVEGIARNAVTETELTTALEDKADTSNVTSWLMGLIIAIVAVLALFFAIVANGRIRLTNKRVATLETDGRDATVNLRGVHIPEDLEDKLNGMDVGETDVFPIMIDGEQIDVRFTVHQKGALKRTLVMTDDIDRQTQPMRVDKLRTNLLGHIGSGRLSAKSVMPKPSYIREAA